MIIKSVEVAQHQAGASYEVNETGEPPGAV